MHTVSVVLAGWQESFIPAVKAYWIKNPIPLNQIKRVTHSGWIETADGQHLNPLHYTPGQPPKRRYSKKGEASGSIKERLGNKKRKRPCTSYFYEWYDDGRKQQRYVQTALMNEVSQMIDQRRPSAEIIQFLNQRSKRKP